MVGCIELPDSQATHCHTRGSYQAAALVRYIHVLTAATLATHHTLIYKLTSSLLTTLNTPQIPGLAVAVQAASPALHPAALSLQRWAWLRRLQQAPLALPYPAAAPAPGVREAAAAAAGLLLHLQS
jgi:hypothetical protein